MTDSVLLYTVDNGVAMLSLNRPHKRNALTQAMYTAMCDAMEQAAADPACRVVLLTGTVERISDDDEFILADGRLLSVGEAYE